MTGFDPFFIKKTPVKIVEKSIILKVF